MVLSSSRVFVDHFSLSWQPCLILYLNLAWKTLLTHGLSPLPEELIRDGLRPLWSNGYQMAS